MSRYFILIILYSFLGKNIKCQDINTFFFKLEGNINTDTGKIKLIPVGGESYYPNGQAYYETNIAEGKFMFSDSICYPHAYRLRFESGAGKTNMSDILLIDPTVQTVFWNINSGRKAPSLDNNSMKELNGAYHNAFRSIDAKYKALIKKQDSLYSKYGRNIPDNILSEILREGKILAWKKDTILLRYTKSNTHSFVALWKLIDRLSDGYEVIFDSIYSQFSNSLKDTYTGQALAKKLETARAVNIGNIFPRLVLLDLKNMRELKPINNFKKYTLIDFWFSHCSPCISQFAKLKTIFATYKAKGFDIISISVDRKEQINDWKEVIKKYQLPWKQYLDISGKEANLLSIDAFPTNFLLNSSGKILIKNIDLNELEKLLKRNLN